MHIIGRDVADTTFDDVESHLLAVNLLERIDDCFDRALSVALDNQGQFLLAVGTQFIEEIIHCNRWCCGRHQFGLFTLGGKFFSQFAGTLLIYHYTEFGTGLGYPRKTHDTHGCGRSGLQHPASTVIHQPAQSSEMLSDQNHIAHFQGP